MQRGIDTNLFSPARRTRADRAFVIGYVGRLSPEKNVRMLAELEMSLVAGGIGDHRFLVVGEGSERAWLQSNLRSAELPGILRGKDLAFAYASMDAFVFPSATDTFGNVVLEAMASGVVPVVTCDGGPKYLVEPGVTGYVADGSEEFAAAILDLHRDERKRLAMGDLACHAAAQFSWDAVFEQVHATYDACFLSESRPRMPRAISPKVRCDEVAVL